MVSCGTQQLGSRPTLQHPMPRSPSDCDESPCRGGENRSGPAPHSAAKAAMGQSLNHKPPGRRKVGETTSPGGSWGKEGPAPGARHLRDPQALPGSGPSCGGCSDSGQRTCPLPLLMQTDRERPGQLTNASQGQLKVWPLRHQHCKETQGLLVQCKQLTSVKGHRGAEGQTG